MKIIAERCKDMNVVLSRKKLEIGNEIAFAGYILSSRGIKPDPNRIKALTQFPLPKDINEWLDIHKSGLSLVLCFIQREKEYRYIQVYRHLERKPNREARYERGAILHLPRDYGIGTTIQNNLKNT